VSLILDAGAFIALEKGDRAVMRRLKSALLEGSVPLTHAGVVAQVWRGGAGSQAPLAKALKSVDVLPVDEVMARQVGSLLAKTRLADVVDAAVVIIANNGDRILTSDPDDLYSLASASGRRLDVVTV